MQRRELAEKIAAVWNRKQQRTRMLAKQPFWSQEELNLIEKIAERVRSGETNEHAAAKEFIKTFSWRSKMATRLKIRKALGKWHKSHGKRYRSATRTGISQESPT